MDNKTQIFSNILKFKEENGKQLIEEMDEVITLKQTGVSRLMGRNIIAWQEALADYKVNGFQLYAFKLASNQDYQEEWLVLRLVDPGAWLLFDGKYVAVSYYDLAKETGLYKSPIFEGEYDNFSELIVGQTIRACDIGHDYIIINLSDNGAEHTLEVPKDLNRLTLTGRGKKRRWSINDDMSEAWIISKTLMFSG